MVVTLGQQYNIGVLVQYRGEFSNSQQYIIQYTDDSTIVLK